MGLREQQTLILGCCEALQRWSMFSIWVACKIKLKQAPESPQVSKQSAGILFKGSGGNSRTIPFLRWLRGVTVHGLQIHSQKKIPFYCSIINSSPSPGARTTQGTSKLGWREVPTAAHPPWHEWLPWRRRAEKRLQRITAIAAESFLLLQFVGFFWKKQNFYSVLSNVVQLEKIRMRVAVCSVPSLAVCMAK